MAGRRLLLINKFYHDRGPAGGVGRYLVQEEEDLQAAGWDVIPFAMADADARPSRWDRYFVPARDYSRPRWSLEGLRDGLTLIWDRQAARRLDALIRESRPQVAHLHNIYHHLTPSLLPVLAAHRIPVAMTLHDLRLLCPAIHMLRRDEVCESCRGGHLHQAILGRCVKDSRVASLLAAAETWNHRRGRLYERTVSVFLCPSTFIRNKYIEWGFPADKLRHLPNFVDLGVWHPDCLPDVGPRDAYLYFGRISKEKGLRDLLDAQALWEAGHAAGSIPQPPLRLLIAGTGPCDGNLRARAAQLQLKTVDILGPLDGDGLRRALGRARFSVLPSRCYENGPMAGLESLAAGVPLVGTDIGGTPEMIVDGKTGGVVPMGNPEGLLAGLLRAAELGEPARLAARAWAERNASRRDHMATLAALLADLASGAR